MFLEYHTETENNFKELSTAFAQVHQVGCMDRLNILVWLCEDSKLVINGLPSRVIRNILKYQISSSQTDI